MIIAMSLGTKFPRILTYTRIGNRGLTHELPGFGVDMVGGGIERKTRPRQVALLNISTNKGGLVLFVYLRYLEYVFWGRNPLKVKNDRSSERL